MRRVTEQGPMKDYGQVYRHQPGIVKHAGTSKGGSTPFLHPSHLKGRDSGCEWSLEPTELELQEKAAK